MNAQPATFSTKMEFVRLLTKIAKISTEIWASANNVILDIQLMQTEHASFQQTTQELVVHHGIKTSVRSVQPSIILAQTTFVSQLVTFVESGIQPLDSALTAIKDINYKMDNVYLITRLQSQHRILYAKNGKTKSVNNVPQDPILILIVYVSQLKINARLGIFKMDFALLAIKAIKFKMLLVFILNLTLP